jgi:predicted Zn-dependent protease
MTIRPKTIRRLLLLASACGASAAIIGAAFTFRRHTRENELADQRSTGMTAFQSGNLAEAMPKLTSYVAARPDDVDAIYALACAHLATETPGRDNLFDARTRLQQVLARRPDYLPAKQQLLTIFERTHLQRELLATADEVLAAAPKDVAAMRSRAVALSELERDTDAIAAWLAYLEMAPTDFKAQAQLLATMKRAGRSPDELVAHARSNVARWPDDPRFQLPLAAALREAGRDGEAKALLEALAAKPQSDAAFVVELSAALDRTRSFDVAEQLLARSAETLGSSSLSTALVERMWQNGRHEQVIAATEGIATASGRRDADALAMRALSMAAVGRQADAAKLQKEVEAIKGDDEATAWSMALAIEFASTSLSPQAQVRTLREALSHDPDNGILTEWLGRSLRVAGEPEQSARCLRDAAQRLPSWPTPCIELADVMLEAGRIADAVVAAKTAYSRAPANAAVQLQVARVRFAEIRAGQPNKEDVDELLARIDTLSRQMPAEPSLPAMRVALLTSRGERARADEAAMAWLAAAPPRANLQPLYEAASRAGLDSAWAVYERAAADGTVTPRLATLYASALAHEDSPAEGIKWIETQTAVHHNDATWRLAEARVRTALGDQAAADLWKSLTQAFPGDASVQAAALTEAGDLVGDRAQRSAIVERLKIIVGEDASQYRIARARWLASSADDAEVRQALTLAADLVRQQPSRAELRVLLARVLVRLDSATTAIDHLRVAHAGAPGDASIAIEFADVLRRAGRAAEGVKILKGQASREVDDPAARAALGRALYDVGAFDEAAALAHRAVQNGAATRDEQLVAAAALEATGDIAMAAKTYQAAIADAGAKSPRVTPAMLATVAAFERRQGHTDRATTLIERMGKVGATTEDCARAIASYAMEFGDVETARQRYAAELATGHASVDLNLDAIDLELGLRDFARASTLAAEAAAKFPDEPRVKRAGLELAVLRARADGAADEGKAMDALIDALAADPASRRQAMTLKALRDAQRSGRPTPELATRLAALVEADPNSVELVRQAIGAALATNQPQLAADLARRLLATGGARVDAVALAAQALLDLRDLPAARRAAERWRAMSASDTTPADVTLARVALADNTPARALASLEPHRATIDWDRDASLPITLAEALAAAGRDGEAFDLLDAALPSRLVARTSWLGICRRTIAAQTQIARLARLEAATPADATDERVRLAGACLEFAQAAPIAGAIDQGIAVLAPLEAAGRLSGNARSLLAELQRASGDLAMAEKTLRDALLAEPQNAMLKNSLAYLLLSKSGDAAEACRLATEATAAAPGQAAFQDTLARALLAAGQAGKAEIAFREALRLDDDLIDAWVGLARLQAQLGRTAEAAASLRHVDASLAKAGNREPPVHLREELRNVRQSVATTHD